MMRLTMAMKMQRYHTQRLATLQVATTRPIKDTCRKKREVEARVPNGSKSRKTVIKSISRSIRFALLLVERSPLDFFEFLNF
jgi:hypothetical protein